jgi:molybdenum-dependent DNA-binding transcriptional regulator ModE
MKQLRTRFKLWLSSRDVEGVFGDGKWRLLKSIDAEGSLRAASQSPHAFR